MEGTMPFVELKLCEKTGKILIEAKKLYKGPALSMVDQWLKSEVFSEIIVGNEVYCSQARTYVARCFIEETRGCGATGTVEIADDILYWFGYVVCYWCFQSEISPSSIAQNYDLSSILNAYEMLHSLSVKTAIEKIREDYHL
jgi:hypothetical protein